MPFPEVEGGAGSIDQVPANVGIPVMFSEKDYDDDTSGVAEVHRRELRRHGAQRLGRHLGLRDRQPAAPTCPTTTQIVQDMIANAPSSVLWFEALFSAKATTVSQTNGGGLASGTLSGADFMELVQAANDEADALLGSLGPRHPPRPATTLLNERLPP